MLLTAGLDGPRGRKIYEISLDVLLYTGKLCFVCTSSY
jgi:hypothetical protein